MVILRIAEWILLKIWAKSLYRAVTKVRNNTTTTFFRKNQSLRSSSSQFPGVTKCNLRGRETQTVVCGDINGTLLRSQSSFPFFMLIAFEGGGIFRAFLLLLSYPVLLLLVFNHQLKLRVMIFLTFCGLNIKNMETVSRAVLPKFYLENLNVHVYNVLASAGSRLVFTSLPKVMVEGFLKDYLNFGTVGGTELHTFGQYYTGFLSSSGILLNKHRDLKEFTGENKPDIGIGSSSSIHDHFLISHCKVHIITTSSVFFVFFTYDQNKLINLTGSLCCRHEGNVENAKRKIPKTISIPRRQASIFSDTNSNFSHVRMASSGNTAGFHQTNNWDFLPVQISHLDRCSNRCSNQSRTTNTRK